MKLLLKQTMDLIYLDDINLDGIVGLDESCKKNFLNLVKYKFVNEKGIEFGSDVKTMTSEIYAAEDQYDRLRKEIYVLAELACSRNVKPSDKYVSLGSIDKIIDFSSKLLNEKKYHLINLEKHRIYKSNMVNTDAMLDKWYSEKVLVKKK